MSSARPQSDNFQVYKARHIRHTYLVVSTSAVRRGSDSPVLCDQFENRDALTRLADEMAAAQAQTGEPAVLTLKVHGYNTRRARFEADVLRDADPQGYYHRSGKRPPPSLRGEDETFRPAERFFVGFRWPSEGMLSLGSLRDTIEATAMTPTVGWALLILPILTLLLLGQFSASLWGCWRGLASALDYLRQAVLGSWQLIVRWQPKLVGVLATLFTPYRNVGTASALLGAAVLFLALRLSTYARDRYRALHYGVPDLGEFMRCLEAELVERRAKVTLDVVGHSMGSLVLINAFRVMSDYFVDPAASGDNGLGRNGTFQLRTMILCAPDLPATMATNDRNNYFLSALRRFRSFHVFSSDRDIILKWLSLLGNWISEPRHDMAGRKLGNVHLVKQTPSRLATQDSRVDWQLVPVTRPVVRRFQLYDRDPLAHGTSPAELHFHDCTREPSLSGGLLPNALTATALLGVLWGLSRWSCPAIWLWLFSALAVFWGAGTLCMWLWMWMRDWGWLGGWAGMFADWPTLTMFATIWVGWNPHSGYFMLCQAPRRRVAALLRNPSMFPPRQHGRDIEEQDGRIRYRRVLVSV